MELHIEPSSVNHISSYSENEIVINGASYDHSIIIPPNDKITPWDLKNASEITIETINALLKHKPTLILIGTGNQTLFLPQSLLAHVYQQKVGIEVMTTPAACRTFNTLLSEGREVAAGLIV